MPLLFAAPAATLSIPLGAQSIAAVRAAQPPRIDGSDRDAVWATAERRSDFRTFAPTEDADPAFRTEMRVAYDDDALYLFVRGFDPRPDSIVRLLSRRDSDGPPNDQFQLFIDSYLDRRSGYEYIVNAAGVQSDYLLFDDTGFDQSWNGVWDVATQVDSLGWTAEFAIPLQELRFRDREAPTFGLMLWRLVGRTGERASWPLYRASRSGYVSQAGTVTGIRLGARGVSVQTIPYVLGRARNVEVNAATGRSEVRGTFALGGDVRVAPRPNVSVDATFNPDFGQVESDPAVLNLSAFEVFQSERRPFFLQGAGLLSFPLANDGSALLFHSRRIGRAPVLAALAFQEAVPRETSILGAAMISARMTPTTSVVALSARTAEERGKDGAGASLVLEPRAHLNVARVQREFRDGRSGVGAMTTRVDRDGSDPVAGALLPSMAQVGALTTQHQSADGNYRTAAWFAMSEVTGSREAIAQLQLSTVHGYQRPDDGIDFDATRRSLGGSAGQLFAGKVAGGTSRYDVTYRWISPGFDVNEMGFLTRAGVRDASTSVGWRAIRPGRALGIPYRNASGTLGLSAGWAEPNLTLARAARLSGTLLTEGFSQFSASAAQELPGAFCTMSCTRGGPALVDEPALTAAASVRGDWRRRLTPQLDLDWRQDDEGRSTSAGASAGFTWRARSNLDIALTARLADATHDAFYFRRFGDPASDTTHHTFARLAQAERSLTTRLNHTVTTGLSVQWYAQVYVSRGRFTDVRELDEPRARRYEDRFRPYAVADGPGGVDLRQFRSNAVLRWEYRPGSTVFLVWTQGRDRDGLEGEPLRMEDDLRDLFGGRPDNVVAVKVSHWLRL